MQFNRHFMNRIEKKDVLRLLLALVAVLVMGVLGEFVCNLPALREIARSEEHTSELQSP